MNFHQTTSERLRDQVFEQLLKLDVFKEGITMASLIEVFPKWDEMSEVVSSSDEEPDAVIKEELFTDTIVDTEGGNNVGDEEDKVEEKAEENVEKKVKEKKVKEKKPKKEKKPIDPDKPKRPPTNFMYFKSHPDSQDDILTASKEINEETGKVIGIPAGAGKVWGKVSDEDKESWKQRAIDYYLEKMVASEPPKTEEMEEIN